jgi:hypothetical protein
MENKNKWIDLSILGLFIVGFSGLIMRTKIVFEVPFINYNHLIEAHSHFTFAGWVSLALMTLMVYEMLPIPLRTKKIYQWLLALVAISSWAMLITYFLKGYAGASIIASFVFIVISFVFGWVFIRDIGKAGLSKSVRLLSISSIVCLMLSSVGTFIIAYIYFRNSFDAILYRDSLFTYLHLQYNGFFSLAIFALLFHHLEKKLDANAQKKMYRFAFFLCASIIPSLFLSYLWADPHPILRMVAIIGSLLLLICSILFVLLWRTMKGVFFEEAPVVRFLIITSMGSFLLKTFLQCFTIFPMIGNAIFGNRPIIMGFLHLVFLAFTSMFILAFISNKGLLDVRKQFVRIALILFGVAILFNEGLLIGQGLMTMLMPGSNFFPWALWVTGICLFTGTILIGIARIITRQSFKKAI